MRPANIFIKSNIDDLCDGDEGAQSPETYSGKDKTETDLVKQLLRGKCELRLGDLGHACRLGDLKGVEDGEPR